MKLNTDTSRLEKFLDLLTQEEGFKTFEGIEYWPLNPTEVLGYIDAEFIRHFYLRIQELREKGYDAKQLARLFEDSILLMELLVGFACMGFKVLEKFDIHKISPEERIDFFNLVFDIIEEKESGFLIDNEARVVLNEKEVDEIVNSYLIRANDNNKGILNGYKVANFALNWSFYYDLLAVFGWHFHGPYKVRINDEELLMLVDEYHNKNLRGIWPKSEEIPFKETIIYSFYKPFEYKLGIFGRLATDVSLGNELKYFKVIVDGEEMTDLKEIDQLKDIILMKSIEQKQEVEKLSGLEKVHKANEFTYATFKDFFGEDWKNLAKKTGKVIDMLGERFLNKEYKVTSGVTKKEMRDKFDPRNNDF